MLKNHPKGLLVAFFSNMGERFGFYTMMAILVLFLQAKFGLSAEKAGNIYSWFYFGIYALALAWRYTGRFDKKVQACDPCRHNYNVCRIYHHGCSRHESDNHDNRTDVLLHWETDFSKGTFRQSSVRCTTIRSIPS